MPIPVHIVSGFLGTGKTSALRHQLSARKGEKIAVIVNDFGEAGFDAETLATDAPFEIMNIPGACVCCTAPEGFAGALAAVLEQKPERLLIEPTGLARPQDLVDTIRRGPQRDELEVAPVTVLIDPRRLASESESERELIAQQAQVADVIVANYTDVCSEEDLARFDAWVGDIWPPPVAVLKTDHGRIPTDAMDWPEDEGSRLAPEHVSEGSCTIDHHHDHEPADSTAGYRARSYRWSLATVFERDRLESAVHRIAAESGAPLARFKGIFHTREGVFEIEYAGGELATRASAHRRDSRADAIFETTSDAPLDFVRSALESAVLSEAERKAQANQIEIVFGAEHTVVLDRSQLAALPDGIGDVSTLFAKRTGEAARVGALWKSIEGPERGHAVICAADGFASEPVPLHALREGVLLHTDGGEPLDDKKGGPFRLLIPDHVPDAPSACANVKSVTRIVVRED
jgi:G3E family GTPase